MKELGWWKVGCVSLFDRIHHCLKKSMWHFTLNIAVENHFIVHKFFLWIIWSMLPTSFAKNLIFVYEQSFIYIPFWASRVKQSSSKTPKNESSEQIHKAFLYNTASFFQRFQHSFFRILKYHQFPNLKPNQNFTNGKPRSTQLPYLSYFSSHTLPDIKPIFSDLSNVINHNRKEECYKNRSVQLPS